MTAEPTVKRRGMRKQRQGVVVTRSGDKTVTVLVERREQHPLYGKVIRRTKRFQAHDERNECAVGDKVCIMETRPLSRRKRWRVVQILRKREAA